MAQYIDKAEVVAEIENRIKKTKSMMQPKYDKFWAGQITAFKNVLKILNTLEGKEVDLDKETQRILDEHFFYPEEDDELKEIPKLARYIAKHFFELGLNARKEG